MPPKNSTFGRGRGRGRSNIRSSKKSENTPVKVKKEKLQDIGHFISPDSNTTRFNIKKVIEILRAQDDTEYREPELKEMLITWRKYKNQSVKEIPKMTYAKVVEELKTIQKRLLGDEDYEYSIDEVIAILKDTRKSRQYLKKMETEELRQMLSVWNQHKKKNENLNSFDHDQLMDELEKAKESMNKEADEGAFESVIDQVDRETDEMFDVVQTMNVNEGTTDDQIDRYTHAQLSYFQYVKSLKLETFPSLEEIQQYEKKQLTNFCKEWRDEAILTKTDDPLSILSDDEEDLYESQGLLLDRTNLNPVINRENRDEIQDEDVVMTDAEEEEEVENRDETKDKEKGPSDVTMMESVVEEKSKDEPIQLDDETTDDEIRNLEVHEMVDIYQKYTTTTSHPIGASTIDLWTKDQLRKKLRTARDTMIRLSQSQKQNSSSLKINRKYSGKPKVQADLESKTAQTWRYNLFFTQPQYVNSIGDLRMYMGSLLTEMKKYQSSARILPWATTDMKDPIDNSEALPITITGLKKYFPNIRAPTGVQKQYIKMRISLPIQTDRMTFEADYIAWCNTQDVKMYFCTVQHPQTKIIGWLVYAPNTMDRDKWSRATQDLYSKAAKDGSTITLGLSWKALAGQWEMSPKDKVYAMHVETMISQASKVKTFLRLIAQRKTFPLGVRFRVMDQFSQYMKATTLIKYKYIRDKHKTCLKELKRYESEKILNLDYKIAGTKMTLRDVVVNIRDDEDGRRIFNSIDARYDRPDVHVAMYRPDKGSKAEAFMDSLPTYLRHLYPNASLSRIFSIEAMEQAEGSEYYPSTQTFLTQEDIELDKEIQMDWDDDSFEHLKNDETENPFEITLPVKLPGGKKLYNFSGDDDTASTIPATSSNLTFTDASVHLYDATSTVSEMSVPYEVHRQIQNQLTKLNAEPDASNSENHTGEANKA